MPAAWDSKRWTLPKRLQQKHNAWQQVIPSAFKKTAIWLVAATWSMEQLDRHEAFFSSRQLLVLKSEDLFQETAAVWEQIQHFLKLRQIPLPMALPHANAGSGEANVVPDAIRKRLRNELSATASGVKKRYGIDWGWN